MTLNLSLPAAPVEALPYNLPMQPWEFRDQSPEMIAKINAYAESFARSCIAAPVEAVVPSDELIERLKDAIEGECDGLSIDDAHARAILEYVLASSPAVLVEPAALIFDAHEGTGLSPMWCPASEQTKKFTIYEARPLITPETSSVVKAAPSAPLAEAAKALSFEVRAAAERMERAYHECYIPTGALWRGITDSKWQQARAAFHEAVKRLAALAEPAATVEEIEFEAVQDGCVQFSAGTLQEAEGFANANGPWAMSIYEVRRRLVSRNGVPGALAAPTPVEPAIKRFNEIEADPESDLKDETPLERLRFFLSVALMHCPQDWLDIEPFLDALAVEPGNPANQAPPEVLAALERMCMPLHESRLSGATAEGDARCMKLIRDYILNPAGAQGGEPVSAGEEPLTDDELHDRHRHPNFEYATTTGPRKAWSDQDRPPEGDGWEANVTVKDPDAWERFDYHEESYWRRLKASGGSA